MNIYRIFLAILSLLVLALMGGCAGDGIAVDGVVTQRVGPAGGTFPFQNGNVVVTIPQNAFSTTTDVTVRQAVSIPTDNRLVSGTAWTITTTGNVNFGTNGATMRIKYNQLPLGANPNALRIFKVEGTQWVLVDTHTTVDVNAKTVTANVAGPGTYAIFVHGTISGPTVYKTVLTTGQETQAVNNLAAHGTATVEVANDRNSLNVMIDSTGLGTVTAAHIHIGALGQSGPVGATLYTQSMGAFGSHYMKVVSATDLNTNVVPNMEALIAAIEAGNAYINVHTTTDGQGNIRGQLGDAVRLVATLNGAQEVPPVDTTATGNATVTFNREMTEMTIMLNTTGLHNVTMAHVHTGIVGQSGPPVLLLFNGGTWNNTMTFTVDASDLMGTSTTFNNVVGAILSGEAYINVHTQAHGGGEIRGQIVPSS